MTEAPASPLFPHRHLLGIRDLSPPTSKFCSIAPTRPSAISRQPEKKTSTLRGRTQINLFYEASTRTQSSFELAGKRLGADVMNMSVASSSVKKGETLIDTAMTLNAMRPDILIIRHQSAGAAALLAQKVGCSVVNAGDGAHEHPTQALLDALTIRRAKGPLSKLIVAICGDILHSRVARSNIMLLNALGAQVRVVAPSTLLPSGIERMGVDCREIHGGRAEGRRRGDDAAAAARAHGRRLRAVGARIFPLFRARRREAESREGRRAGHASGPDEPRRRDRLGNRRRAAERDPGAGRDGRRGAHGGDGGAARPAPQSLTETRHERHCLQHARIVDPSRGLDETGTVIVDGKKIVAAGAAALNQGAPEGATIIDCRGKTIIPGLVDCRVFIGEPGAEHRETIASASHAAAAGGVTSIVMMPDTDPVIDDVALVEFVLRAARDTASVNVFPAAAITKRLEGREMTEFGLLREAGAVASPMDATRSPVRSMMRRALTYARDFGAVIAHETQDADLSASRRDE